MRSKPARVALAAAVLAGGLGLGLVGSSCDVLIQHVDTVTTQVPPSNISPDATLIRKFKDKYGHDQFVYEVLIKDPDGYFTGKVALRRQHGGGPAAGRLQLQLAGPEVRPRVPLVRRHQRGGRHHVLTAPSPGHVPGRRPRAP